MTESISLIGAAQNSEALGEECPRTHEDLNPISMLQQSSSLGVDSERLQTLDLQ
jgi:hypothetical protein